MYASVSPSNDPIEDAHFTFFEPGSRCTVVGVLDGHGGDHCADFVRRTLPPLLATHLHRLGPAPAATVASDWAGAGAGAGAAAGAPRSAPSMTMTLPQWLESIRKSLMHAFVEVDLLFRKSLAAPVRKNNSRGRILGCHYNAGSCGLVVVLGGGHAVSANVGDSRAVLGSAVPVAGTSNSSSSKVDGAEAVSSGKQASSSAARASSDSPPGAYSKPPSPTEAGCEMLCPAGLTHEEYAILAGVSPVRVRPKPLTTDHNCRNPQERAAVFRRTNDPTPFRNRPVVSAPKQRGSQAARAASLAVASVPPQHGTSKQAGQPASKPSPNAAFPVPAAASSS